MFLLPCSKKKEQKTGHNSSGKEALKQVFGVVKNECLFDRNYYKKLV